MSEINLQSTKIGRLGDPERPPTAGLPILTLNGEVITADSSSRFIIGDQTLAPGGIVTMGGTRISMDVSATQVLIDATATISLDRNTQNVNNIEEGRVITKTFVTIVIGGITQTFQDGRTSVIGGTTTVIPADGLTGNQDSFRVVIGGSTTVLGNDQVAVAGRVTSTVPAGAARDPSELSLTLPDVTIRLPGSGILVFGGVRTVLTVAHTTGASSITVVYGGRTMTLADGRITVDGGTTTVVPAPAASSITVVYGGRTMTLADGRITVDGGTTTVIPASGAMDRLEFANEILATDTDSVIAKVTSEHASLSTAVDSTDFGGRFNEAPTSSTSGACAKAQLSRAYLLAIFIMSLGVCFW